MTHGADKLRHGAESKSCHCVTDRKLEHTARPRSLLLMWRALQRCVPPSGHWRVGQGIRSFASEAESAIEEKLQKALTVKQVNVRDTSGGCGTMFEIRVIAEEFQSKSIVQQHKIVTKALQADIAQWHGFTLLTSPPQ